MKIAKRFQERKKKLKGFGKISENRKEQLNGRNRARHFFRMLTTGFLPKKMKSNSK